MLQRLLFLILTAGLWSTPLKAQQPETSQRYASHSVLATGRWAKIRVPETGVYQITDSLAQAAGFSSAARIRVYGYGGRLQPDKYPDEYLQQNDDLKEVTTLFDGQRRLFYATGPVNWNTMGTEARVKNYFSDYGYYFLTEADTEHSELEVTDSTAFAETFYPAPFFYHSHYEVDDFAWYHGGRNLYDARLFGIGTEHTYTLPAYDASGTITLCMSFDRKFEASVAVGDSVLSIITPGASVTSSTSGLLIDGNAVAGQYTWKLSAKNVLQPLTDITIKQLSGGELRLDYITVNSNRPKPLPPFAASSMPTPEIVGIVANQDRHGDALATMVIIVPANRQLMEQAARLKQLHEEADGMHVNLVAADELYNEFSSGTPDANAYRRYMKMLYDRAPDTNQRPRYLLLFGDGAWDNRLLLKGWGSVQQEDLLLCYESENSFSATKCIVTDDYFGLLDDNDGGNMLRADLLDLSVGRLPVRTEEQAKGVVDKIIAYRHNDDAGPWQNLLCFMGDDGNQNMHMNDAEVVIREVKKYHQGYDFRKIYWDAYPVSKLPGHYSYPEVERQIHDQMDRGALVMNYTGHGGERSFSHEYVVRITDFERPTSMRLPLWVTASCNVMPFDGQERTIGEAAVLNPQGGAIAFFGTARTVYAYYNQYMNKTFMRHVLASTGGRRNSIGDAVRIAKNQLISTGDDRTENKFQYVLLGDPAIVLSAPTLTAQIDEIDGEAVGSEPRPLVSGSRVTFKGSIPGHEDFNGKLSVTMRDALQTILGRVNNTYETDTAIVFLDRLNTVYTGTHDVVNGKFQFTFTVPRDILYMDGQAQLLLFAKDNSTGLAAHGECNDFCFVGSDSYVASENGPIVNCYLNSPDFCDGDDAGQLAHFVAEIYDEDGINAAGCGLGHDMELIIDNKTIHTYRLSDFFRYQDGDDRTGRAEFDLPLLSYGTHQLLFRVWDMLDNPTTAIINFRIVDPLGINDLTVQPEEDNGQGVYDTAGRRVDRQARTRSGLYLYRHSNGEVKKMLKAGQ